MYKKILVAVDGSDHALNAVRSAVKIARGSGATLYLLAVDGCRPLKGPLAELAKDEDLSRDEIFERVLESAAITAKIPDTIHVEQLVRIGDPADIILAEAGKTYEVSGDLKNEGDGLLGLRVTWKKGDVRSLSERQRASCCVLGLVG